MVLNTKLNTISKILSLPMYNYTYLTTELVDDTKYYMLHVNDDILTWLEELGSSKWYRHLSNPHMHNVVDVDEELYMIIKLKF
jgi:hypothetical protein